MAHIWRKGLVEHRTSAHQNDCLLMAESNMMIFIGIAVTRFRLMGELLCVRVVYQKSKKIV